MGIDAINRLENIKTGLVATMQGHRRLPRLEDGHQATQIDSHGLMVFIACCGPFFTGLSILVASC